MDIALTTLTVKMEEKGRKATLTFGTCIQGGDPALFFKDCAFSGLSITYTFDDWLFLNMVASEIIALHLRTLDKINWSQFRFIHE